MIDCVWMDDELDNLTNKMNRDDNRLTAGIHRGQRVNEKMSKIVTRKGSSNTDHGRSKSAYLRSGQKLKKEKSFG